MTRVFITIVVPLFLPTALYLLWMASLGRGESGAAMKDWRTMPWMWLVGAGAVLMVVVFVVAVEFGGGGEGSYVPPHLKNGQIVPGEVVPNGKD